MSFQQVSTHFWNRHVRSTSITNLGRRLFPASWLKASLTLFSGVLITALLLAGCGGTSPVPSTFVATDAQSFASLSWRQQQENVAGDWTVITVQSGLAMPKAITLHIQGQLANGQTLTLSAGNNTLQGTLDQQILTTTATINGQTMAQTWYDTSNEASSQLGIAFVKYEVLHQALSSLQAMLRTLPSDSDPTSYALSVQNAQTYVNNLRSWEMGIRTQGNPCGTGVLSNFENQYPPEPNTFSLTPSPRQNPSTAQASATSPQQRAQALATNSTLGQQLLATQQDWQTAHTTPVPAISGLSLPWIVQSSDEATQVSPAVQSLLHLQQLLTTDEQSMDTLQAQTQQIGMEVTTIRQTYGC